MNVKCPQCGKSVVYSTENRFRPFCSERCQLIDLGAWAEGKYAVPVGDATVESATAEEQDDFDGQNPHSEPDSEVED